MELGVPAWHGLGKWYLLKGLVFCTDCPRAQPGRLTESIPCTEEHPHGTEYPKVIWYSLKMWSELINLYLGRKNSSHKKLCYFLYSSCTHFVNSCTAQLHLISKQLLHLWTVTKMISQQITFRNLQNSLTVGKITNTMSSIAPWWLYLTSLIFDFLQILFNQFSIFFMICFTAFTHITLLLTESSIPTFHRLINIFFSMTEQLLVIVHVSSFVIGKRALIENMLILKRNAIFRAVNVLRPATLLQQIIWALREKVCWQVRQADIIPIGLMWNIVLSMLPGGHPPFILHSWCINRAANVTTESQNS